MRNQFRESVGTLKREREFMGWVASGSAGKRRTRGANSE
jgi:hypothetical protein